MLNFVFSYDFFFHLFFIFLPISNLLLHNNRWYQAFCVCTTNGLSISSTTKMIFYLIAPQWKSWKEKLNHRLYIFIFFKTFLVFGKKISIWSIKELENIQILNDFYYTLSTSYFIYQITIEFKILLYVFPPFATT